MFRSRIIAHMNKREVVCIWRILSKTISNEGVERDTVEEERRKESDRQALGKPGREKRLEMKMGVEKGLG